MKGCVCVWSPPGHVYLCCMVTARRALAHTILIDCSARISVVWIMVLWTGLWKRSCGPRAPSFPCRAAPPTWWSTTLASIWVRGRDRRAQYMTATSCLIGIVVTKLLCFANPNRRHQRCLAAGPGCEEAQVEGGRHTGRESAHPCGVYR